MSSPFFSIIIPTFNSSATLRSCLASILLQRFKDYEVLAVDGGSTDKTVLILNEYTSEDMELRYISEKDEGIYDGMNKGIAMAKGVYLYFLGSDDTMFDGEVLSKVAHELNQANVKVLYGNVMMRGSNRWVNGGRKHAGEFDLKRLLSHNICHQSIFFHNSVFHNLGSYNIRYRVFADHDFNLRCYASYKFVYTDLIIANFNLGGASTHLTDEEFEKDKIANVINYFFHKLHTQAFVGLRLYVQQAAFSKNVRIGFSQRLYCLLVYIKLKTQSLLT